MVRCYLIFHKLKHFWKAISTSVSPANPSFTLEFVFLIKHLNAASASDLRFKSIMVRG